MKAWAVLAIGAALVLHPARAEMPEPGKSYFVSPTQLPRPGETRAVANPSRIVSRPQPVPLQVPKGFQASLFAEGLENARWLAVAPDGEVILAQPALGRVVMLKDQDGDGRAESREILAQGLNRPHGLAFQGGFLYIGDRDHVWRLSWPVPSGAKPLALTAPGALGDGGGHWTRNLAFSPDGTKLYVAVGSRSNIGEEDPPRASILEFSRDGSGGRVIASGLRNPVGIAIRPGSDELWAVVNERDGLGDGLVPDYLARIREGGFYGWPYSYIGRNPQPGYESKRPDLTARALTPDLLFRAHSAPLGLVFYNGGQFPPDYRGDAFVALHGSWNSSSAEGYMIARVRFRDGQPQTGYETFASGFLLTDGPRIEAWGRPVGLAAAKDGSLLVADDAGNAVWRISYKP